MPENKHWTLEEMSILTERCPLDGDPPNKWDNGRLAAVSEEIGRTPGAVGAKWYELSAAGGWREVKGRGAPPRNMSGAGLIRKLAREAERISKENEDLRRENTDMKEALEYGARVLATIERGDG